MLDDAKKEMAAVHDLIKSNTPEDPNAAAAMRHDSYLKKGAPSKGEPPTISMLHAKPIRSDWGRLTKTAQTIGTWTATRAVREKWSFDAKETFEKKIVHADTYNKIKTTNVDWKVYDKLVLDLGGWGHPPAVIGANIIVATTTIFGWRLDLGLSAE